MTIASVLVQAGYREGNIIPVGGVPTAVEQTEGLALFNSLLAGVFGSEMGENLVDWPVPLPQRTAPIAANYPQLPYPQGLDGNLLSLPVSDAISTNMAPFPPKNSRLIFGGVTVKVYFPEAPEDGSRMALVQGSGAGDAGAPGQIITLDGNGRTIETTATKAFVDPVLPRQWLYRADLSDWVAVVPMLIGDSCPFPPELDDLWITMLAMRLAPRFGKATSAETGNTYKAILRTFKARYRQAGTTTYGSSDFPRSLQSYISGRWWW